jgi:hypothetical protein
MFVRINEWRKRDRRFDHRVQPKAQFRQKSEIRPETRSDDQFVHDDVPAAA